MFQIPFLISALICRSNLKNTVSSDTKKENLPQNLGIATIISLEKTRLKENLPPFSEQEKSFIIHAETTLEIMQLKRKTMQYYLLAINFFNLSLVLLMSLL